MGKHGPSFLKKLCCLGLLTCVLTGCAIYAPPPPRRVVVYQPGLAVYAPYYHYWR